MKDLLGFIAVMLTLIGYAPLLYKIFKGNVKPHPFTWFIWTFATLTVFFAQAFNNGGAGAWSIGFSGSITFVITIFAFSKRSDYKITIIDWVFLLVAFSALPLWFFTSNALYAVFILTVVDLLGYGPTLRKAYYRPHEEYIPTYVIMSIRNIVSIFAMREISLTNTLFQFAVTIANTMVITIILLQINKHKKLTF